MTASRRIVCFVNIGHAIDHMFVMIFPAAVLGMRADFGRRYHELIALSLGGSTGREVMLVAHAARRA